MRHDRIVAAAGGPCWCGTTRTARVRVPGAAGAFDPRLSPDGSWITWVEPGGLHLRAWDGTQPSILAGPEGRGVLGGSRFHRRRRVVRSRGYWWLPDSRASWCSAPTSRRSRSGTAAIPPILTKRRCPARYPHAGANNARVELWRFDLAGEERADRAARLRVPGRRWAGVVTLLNREQTELTVGLRRSRSGAEASAAVDRPGSWPASDRPRRKAAQLDRRRPRRLTIDGEAVRGDVASRPGGRRCAARVRHRLHRSGGEPACGGGRCRIPMAVRARALRDCHRRIGASGHQRRQLG